MEWATVPYNSPQGPGQYGKQRNGLLYCITLPEILMSGLTKSGHLRLRSGEAYTIDLEDEEPHSRQLERSAFTSVGSQSVVVPPPRLDHVVVRMPCGRIIIFGGSMYDRTTVRGFETTFRTRLVHELES